MRLKKRSKMAKDRERLKKQRIDPQNSDGSQYVPSDNNSEAASDDQVSPQCPKPDIDRDVLYGLWELESDNVSESDGEIMLGLDDLFDENDWDPGVVPDFYPIFNEPVCICLFHWLHYNSLSSHRFK
jgi:hypothetical protein